MHRKLAKPVQCSCSVVVWLLLCCHMSFMTSHFRKDPWGHWLWKWYLPTFNSRLKDLGHAQSDWMMTARTHHQLIIPVVFYRGGTETEVFIFRFMAFGIREGRIGNSSLPVLVHAVQLNPVYYVCLSSVPKPSIQAATLQRLWFQLSFNALLEAAIGFGHLVWVVLFTEQMTNCSSAPWMVFLWWCVTSCVASCGKCVPQSSKILGNPFNSSIFLCCIYAMLKSVINPAN